jgi:hypothetical protein
MKKEPEDRNKLKIASFRTTDGDWFDFSQVAESNGLTATDVLKACMIEYQAGTYTPVINTPVSMRIQAAQGLTAEEVQDLINTGISTVSNDLLNLQAQLAKLTANRDNWDDLTADVADLREQLAEVKADCDLTTEGIQRLIADAISKVSIDTAKKPQPIATKSAPAPGEVHKEVLKVARRLEKEPELKSAVLDGLTAGHTGENLGQYLADMGFLNGNGGKYTGASNSRFRLAIEYLSSLEDGGQE